MKISIITATYNSQDTLNDTLDSVVNQESVDVEHLIIDGNSKDETLRIASNYTHIASILSEPDKGIYDAMNKGVSRATGEIVGILNSDDLYENHSVLEKVSLLFESKKVDAVYGNLVYVNPTDTSKIVRKWNAGPYKKSKWLHGWMPPHPTFFVRRSVYEELGVFDLDLKSSADYEIMLRFLYKNNIQVTYLNETLVRMRTGGQSNISLKNRILANKEDRLAWEKNDLKPPFYTTYFKPIRKIPQFFKK